MRQERQTALKETAELRRELNGGGGPLGPARLAEIHAQLDAKMAAATRRKEEMLRQEKRRKREANAARLSAAAARVANQREEKHRKIAGKVAGKGKGTANGMCALDMERHQTWRPIDVPLEVFAKLFRFLLQLQELNALVCLRW